MTASAATQSDSRPLYERLARETALAANAVRLLGLVEATDYFAMFGLPRKYQFDVEELRRRYLETTRVIHPDRFAGQDSDSQETALRLAAAVNRAYETVRDPLARAEYLLRLCGGPPAADDKRVPPDLLARVMVMREKIDEARGSGDATVLSSMKNAVLAERDEAMKRMAALADDLPGGKNETRDELRVQLNAMKYYENLLVQLK